MKVWPELHLGGTTRRSHASLRARWRLHELLPEQSPEQIPGSGNLFRQKFRRLFRQKFRHRLFKHNYPISRNRTGGQIRPEPVSLRNLMYLARFFTERKPDLQNALAHVD